MKKRLVLSWKCQKMFWVGGFAHGSVGLQETTIFFVPPKEGASKCEISNFQVYIFCSQIAHSSLRQWTKNWKSFAKRHKGMQALLSMTAIRGVLLWDNELYPTNKCNSSSYSFTSVGSDTVFFIELFRNSRMLHRSYCRVQARFSVS